MSDVQHTLSEVKPSDGEVAMDAEAMAQYLSVMHAAASSALDCCATTHDRQHLQQALYGLLHRTVVRDEREDAGDVVERALSMLRRTQGRRCAGIALPGYPALEDALYGMRGVTLLTGPTGAGKTALTLSLALNVASGRALVQEFGNHWDGEVDVLADADRARVVYVTAELEPETLVQRMLAMLAGIGVREMLTGLDALADTKDGAGIKPWHDGVATLKSLMHDGWLHVTTAEGVNWEWQRGPGAHALMGLQNRVRDLAQGRPTLVVLDSIATLDSHVLPAGDGDRQPQYRSDLDRDADIAHGMRRWRRELLTEGSALLAVHEESKASTGTGDIHAARGSSRYAYSMDGMLALMHAHAEGGTQQQHNPDDEGSTVRSKVGVTDMEADAQGTDVDVVVNKARDGGRAGSVVMMRHMWGRGWVTEATCNGESRLLSMREVREVRKVAAGLRSASGGRGKGGRK